MNRPAAALVAALILATSFPAARAHAQAAGPFPEVRMPDRSGASHRMAYLCIGAGFGLLAGSTWISERANDRYDEYLHAVEPGEVETLYDQTLRLDRLSTATLLAGEALVGAGLYLRFLRRPPASRVALDLGYGRCAVSLRF